MDTEIPGRDWLRDVQILLGIVYLPIFWLLCCRTQISRCTVHIQKNVDFISVLRKKPQFSFCPPWYLGVFSEMQVMLCSAQIEAGRPEDRVVTFLFLVVLCPPHIPAVCRSIWCWQTSTRRPARSAPRSPATRRCSGSVPWPWMPSWVGVW